MMNETNQGNNFNPSPAIPIKRKRGRPRKDKSLNRVESGRLHKDQNLNRIGSASAPPGFGGRNGNHTYHQVEPITAASDGMVGQAVTGVVEAVFDAGYLLAVKIGNSNTCLRGVVFKPGHYAPVTAENDVAPRAQMIGRTEILLPSTNRTWVRRSRSRERRDQHLNYIGNGSLSLNELHRVAPQTASTVSSKGKNTAIVIAPSVPPVGARGTVVPVVLQPVNPPNGLSPANQVSPAASQAAHMMALKGKHVQTVTPLAVYAPNGSTLTHQNSSFTSDALTSDSQTSSHVTPKGEAAEFRQGDEVKPTNPVDTYTSDEVTRGFQGTSQSSEAHDGNGKGASKLAPEESGTAPEQESSDMSEPLFIEPLRTVHTGLYNQPTYFPQAMESNRIGRMTELLQAVQENLKDNQLHAERLASYSKLEFHEPRIQGTVLCDEEIVQTQTPSV